MTRAKFEIVDRETTVDQLVIRDVGMWDRCPTVTNDVDAVIAELHQRGQLPANRRLFYYDSARQYDEIRHDGNGHFVGFAPGGPHRPSH